jgi:hypothetical protein
MIEHKKPNKTQAMMLFVLGLFLVVGGAYIISQNLPPPDTSPAFSAWADNWSSGPIPVGLIAVFVGFGFVGLGYFKARN